MVETAQVEGWENGRCVRCKRARTPEGHDPCMKNLPNVVSACCGHGLGDGHITFSDGRTFYFVKMRPTWR